MSECLRSDSRKCLFQLRRNKDAVLKRVKGTTHLGNGNDEVTLRNKNAVIMEGGITFRN